MRYKGHSMRHITRALAAFALLSAGPAAPRDPALAARVKQVTRASVWTRVAAIPVRFPTFHPQGMVRIGDTFVVSSVDKTGAKGHLIKIAADGGLIAAAWLV